MKEFQKKELLRISLVRLKGLVLILEGISESELAESNLVINEVGVALVDIADTLSDIKK